MEHLNDIMILDDDDFQSLSIEERRARNLKAFENLGAIADELREYTPSSELVFLENGQADVVFRGTHLYDGKGAQDFAEEQMETFWKRPVNINTGLVTGEYLDRHTQDFGERFFAKVDEAGIEVAKGYDQPTTRHCFFLFVFGIGLAPHIKPMVDETECRLLALFDVNHEFLYHSLSVFDWASLILQMRAEGRRLLIAIDNNPAALQGRVQSAIRQFNPSGIDGTYLYTHYNNVAFEKTVDDLLKGGGLRVGMMGLGFLWDEMRMIAHTYKNLETGTARVLKRLPSTQEIPAFVVANGPSLDETIDFIKEHQNDAIILACGSALDPLLVNGIKPDVLLMLEQSKGLLDDQKESAKLTDLSDIVFAGASNIYPGVMNHHNDRILFFRPGLSTCPLFSQHKDQRPIGADPLVANAGMMFATFAGFKNIYWFGVDAGAPSAEYHHSKHSQYSTRGVKYRHKFNEKGRGNFGGEFLSTTVLMWSKKGLEVFISRNGGGRTIYNCSNGLFVKGTIPKHHSTLEIPKARDKKAIIRDLVASFPKYEVSDFEEAWEKADLLNALPALSDKLVKCLDEDLQSYDFLRKAMLHLDPGSNTRTDSMVLRGTVFNILMVIYTSLRRLKDEDRMEDLQDIAREVFAECMGDFIDECDEWFTSLVDDTMEWET